MGSKIGKAYKLALIHGPYRVSTVLDCGVDVRPVDKPNATLICAAMNHRHYPTNTFWPPKTPPNGKTPTADIAPETQ